MTLAQYEFSPVKLDVGKLIDTVANRQTQYYTLWGFYTVVEFSAGGFGSPDKLTFETAIAVLCGVWVFNVGHLAFVLACVAQLNLLARALAAALNGDVNRERLAIDAFLQNSTGLYIWAYWGDKAIRKSFITNSLVHVSIDICASVALMLRVSHS